jgi:hypothetical protein
VTHAADDFGAVALDLHAPAAPVAPLSTLKLAVNLLLLHRQAGGQAFEDGDERAPV